PQLKVVDPGFQAGTPRWRPGYFRPGNFHQRCSPIAVAGAWKPGSVMVSAGLPGSGTETGLACKAGGRKLWTPDLNVARAQQGNCAPDRVGDGVTRALS